MAIKLESQVKEFEELSRQIQCQLNRQDPDMFASAVLTPAQYVTGLIILNKKCATMGELKEQDKSELKRLRNALTLAKDSLRSEIRKWSGNLSLSNPYDGDDFDFMEGKIHAFQDILVWIESIFEPKPMRYFEHLRKTQIHQRCEYAIIEPNPSNKNRYPFLYVLNCHSDTGALRKTSILPNTCWAGCLKKGSFKCFT